MTPAMTPHEPRRISTQSPVGGRLGSEPEHFLVDEIPLYEPSGAGEHLYVKLQKRGLGTPDLARIVAKAARVRERDIGYAGLKDKHAVTSQWLSFPKQALPPEQWELPDSIRVLEVSLHTNKLRTGHLKGNRFSIRVRGVPFQAALTAQRVLERLARDGLPNRSGEPGDLFAEVRIMVPATLTDDERRLFEELARTSTFNPRRRR